MNFVLYTVLVTVSGIEKNIHSRISSLTRPPLSLFCHVLDSLHSQLVVTRLTHIEGSDEAQREKERDVREV